MKNSIYITVFILFVIIGCTTKKPSIVINTKTFVDQKDTVRIANDSLQYEVIIIDPGFNTWLNSRALPRNYYSLVFLENKNRIYINEWNNRVLQPMKYNPNLYLMLIDYNLNVKYGYEVNYLIYNYMIYFQNTYKQKLDGYVPMR
jgi:hypothetical protein